MIKSGQGLFHVFVYGTLKTRQIRESNWPAPPVQIRNAWTLGRLYDTGPFPALVRGSDRVAGQVWSLRNEDKDLTLKVLDEIEVTGQPGLVNEYDRCEVSVTLETAEKVDAQIYFYAQLDRIVHFDYLAPESAFDGHLMSIWPQGSEWLV